MSIRATPSFYCTIASITSCLFASTLSVQAQILPDDTLPNNSVVTPNGNTLTLTGGTAADTNLFHSFEQFSVLAGQTTYFNNALSIQNILTRVTGGNISSIDGLIQANGTANLFLINPNGIIFGQNAQLNIGGSFTASTADGIKLGDNAFYSAIDTANSSLLTIQPGVLFTNASRNHTAQITNEGNLAVAPGQDLTLQGDEITITGSVTAQGGNLNLNSNGNISLTDSTVTNTTNVGVTGNGSIQIEGENITLERSQIISSTSSNQTGPDVTINATGNLAISGFTPLIPNQDPLIQLFNSRISSETYEAGAAGDVTVNAAQLNFEDGGQIVTWVGPQATGNGGKVTVNINSITANGAYPFSPIVTSGIASYTLGLGEGGDVDVSSPRINLSDGAMIFSFVQGAGKGGDIQVNTAESVEASGVNFFAPFISSGIIALTIGKGDGGKVNLSTQQLRLLRGANVAAYSFNQLIGNPLGAGEGKAGDIEINAQQVEIVGTSPLNPDNLSGIFNSITGSGNAGNINVTTDTLSIRDGAALVSSIFTSTATFGQPPLPNSGTGNSGNVTVNASESIEVIGSNPLLLFPSRLGTLTFSRGNAGNTIIDAPQIRLLDGGIITSGTSASGDAGEITIDSSEIFISGTTADQFPAGVEGSALAFNTAIQQALFVPPGLTGKTGEVTINTDNLTIQDGGQIRVRHQGSGDAGTLIINADSILLDQEGQINATTALGLGGNIVFNVDSLLLLRNAGSITATALGGTGNGGNLNINAPLIVAVPEENSDITANAQAGSGGRVSITAQGIFGTQFRDRVTPLSDITATSELGVEFNGEVQINIQGIDPVQGLAELPATFADASNQIAQTCSSQARDNSFVVTGRGGLPPTPGEALNPSPGWIDWRVSGTKGDGRVGEIRETGRTEESSDQQSPIQNSLIEATGWVRDADGTVQLVAETSAEVSSNRYYLKKCL